MDDWVGLHSLVNWSMLNTICQDCYHLFREPDLHHLCRSEQYFPFFGSQSFLWCKNRNQNSHLKESSVVVAQNEPLQCWSKGKIKKNIIFPPRFNQCFAISSWPGIRENCFLWNLAKKKYRAGFILGLFWFHFSESLLMDFVSIIPWHTLLSIQYLLC